MHFWNNLHQVHFWINLHQVHFWNNLHQVHFWNNLHQVHFWNNLHQVHFWNNLHQVHFWNNLHQVHVLFIAIITYFLYLSFQITSVCFSPLSRCFYITTQRIVNLLTLLHQKRQRAQQLLTCPWRQMTDACHSHMSFF